MQELILHIPHSSAVIPFTNGYVVSEEVLQAEILKLTDWYTDDLFASEFDISIIAQFSRIFCDVERFADDSKEEMCRFGMGVLYEKTEDGQTLRIVTTELRKKILEEYYWKHHHHFTGLVAQALAQHGQVTIIDCHSFPSVPLRCSVRPSGERPHFNIGTDTYHTPQALADRAEDFFKAKGYSVLINKPYDGSIVPLDYYGKDKRVRSIMLEINRGLYLDEPSNVKSSRYHEIKAVVGEFLDVMRAPFNT